MILKKSLPLIMLATLTLVMVSCAPEGPTAESYGLFSGFWHGVLFPFALIGKLFGMDVGLYAQTNSGFLYWVGFILGVLLYAGGGAKGSRRC